MKFVIIFLVLTTVNRSYCAKSLKFISVNDCSTNKTVAVFEKCEIDDVYATLKINLNTPIVKLVITIKIDLIQNDKIIQTLNIQKLDWCSMFKNGKLPANPLWKIIMAGFGKQISKYTKCPIKNEIVLNRIKADPKMMIFLPSAMINCSITADIYGGNGAKDFASVLLTAQTTEN